MKKNIIIGSIAGLLSGITYVLAFLFQEKTESNSTILFQFLVLTIAMSVFFTFLLKKLSDSNEEN